MKHALLFITISLLSMMKGMDSINNFADVPCGKVFGGRDPKVVGGTDAEKGEFPWIVSITKYGGHFCGGSLITRKHILTAAHCLCGGFDFVKPRQIKISLGQHDLRESDVYKYELPIISYTIHPNYTCDRPANDIAVLEIGNSVQWSQRVSPICIPSSENEENYKTFADTVATVAGWGWTKEDSSIGSRANVLQKADVNIIETEQCQSWYKSQGKKVKISNKQMCAGYKNGGIDACWADSGGPLMVNLKNTNQMVIAGVVSTGIGCARPYLPGLYTRISEYVPWLQTIVN